MKIYMVSLFHRATINKPLQPVAEMFDNWNRYLLVMIIAATGGSLVPAAKDTS